MEDLAKLVKEYDQLKERVKHLEKRNKELDKKLYLAQHSFEEYPFFIAIRKGEQKWRPIIVSHRDNYYEERAYSFDELKDRIHRDCYRFLRDIEEEFKEER